MTEQRIRDADLEYLAALAIGSSESYVGTHELVHMLVTSRAVSEVYSGTRNIGADHSDDFFSVINQGWVETTMIYVKCAI